MIKVILTLVLTAVVASAWFMPSFGINNNDSTNIDKNYVRDEKQKVVIDKKNSKMFYDSSPTKRMHFIRAWSYCQKMDYLGKTNWRVPTKDESRDLLELSRPNVKSKHAFINVDRERYWTSTEFRDGSDAWYVDFDLGRYSTEKFTKLYRVICVRDLKD